MTSHVDTNPPLILVLLPVYNGERFLHEQIESILSQTHNNLKLVCRDDGSSDSSLQVLEHYAAAHPATVQVLRDSKGNLGAAGNFSALMQWASEQCGNQPVVYFALADQDDTWHPEKLERCLAAMLVAESNNNDVPVLVHSDLRVVDKSGQEIAPSFMTYQGLRPERTAFCSQLVSNTVTGCTCLMNTAMLQKALPVPTQAIMHDWWLSLVASAFGRLIYLSQPLVEYRQHGRNTIGAQEYKPALLNLQTLKKLFQIRKSELSQRLFEQSAAQAVAFADRFKSELKPEQTRAIADVARLPLLGLWRQRFLFRRLARRG